MSKTIEEIKTQWAKDHSYENYSEFLDLTRKCDTDHVFIMDGAVTQIAKRYAQSQTQEIKEQNEELIDGLRHIAIMLRLDAQISVDSIYELIRRCNYLNQM